MSSAGFAHLRVHSEYSIVEGLAKVGDLVDRAAELGMTAVALTDQDRLFGLIKFHKACLNRGVKPILGIDLHHQPEGREDRRRLTVLACSAAGYRNLLRLASGIYTGAGGRKTASMQQIVEHSQGLILLSGAPDSEIGHALLHKDAEGAERAARHLLKHFPDRFYLEVLRTGRAEEEACLRAALGLAERLNLPLAATNDACFLTAEHYEAHETRVCIHEGKVVHDPRRPRRHSPEQYLKSAEAMMELFADLPEAVLNTLEIAKRCTVELELGRSCLPNYPVPGGGNLTDYLARAAREGLAERLAEIRALGTYAADDQVYQERLAYELGVINETGYPGYFLIVMEFIAWAKEQEIPVGPGRGSGAGSLVAYALGITDLDPVHYDLLFERFLNPERVSMPDFDVDFCVEGRDRVIQHVSALYGDEAVSQIATFGSMAAKAVVRDVARSQGKPYALGDKLAKLIPNRLDITLAGAVAESAELKEFVRADEEAGEVMDMAYKLEGVVRNVGQHAGGVVIAPSRLTDFVPLYVDEQSGSLISQYDKDDVEQAGLVKFDFLGLTTLTIIDWAVRAINRSIKAAGDGAPIDISRLPMDDRSTYDLLKRTDTVGLFQLESRGMKELIRRLQPDSIDDIIALVALYRPGPLQNEADKDYIERKHGRAKISYPHPELEPVLKNTFGVVIYQEQVMQIAQVLAGFSLGQADILRKAMGKKDPEEMAKVRDQFLAGAEVHGVAAALANKLFDQMATFAGYAFNKSHSATYALVAYQTAWLKAHHPAEFMAATLSAQMKNTDKVAELIHEVRRLRLKLRSPSVNRSEHRFSVVDGDIIYGLGALSGVGAAPVESIIAARQAGPFTSLRDFCLRVDVKRVHKRVLEALVQAGATDEFAEAEESLEAVRARLLGELEQALQAADQASRNAALGINDMFGGVGEEQQPALASSSAKALTYAERLELEKSALGLYLTGHPVDPYLAEFGVQSRLADVPASASKQRLFGLVADVWTNRQNAGRERGKVVMDDGSARMEAVLHPEVYERSREKVEKDAVLLFEGVVEFDRYSNAKQLRVDRVFTIEEWRERAGVCLRINLNGEEALGDLPHRLKAALKPHQVGEGGCPVTVGYQAAELSGSVRLGWRVKPAEALLQRLRAEFGDDRVQMDFNAQRP